MRVLHVASEVAPFAQSGGLADVVAGLPAAQAAQGVTPAVLVPLYRGVEARLAAARVPLDSGLPLQLPVGPHTFGALLRRATVGGVRYGFLDIPGLYNRAGTLYGPDGGSEFGDNHLRFGALGRAAQLAGEHLLGGPLDILHAHDWQGGPAALYARLSGSRTKIVVTIHNLAFRGVMPKWVMDELGLPWSIFTAKEIEFYDQVSLLKGALAAADLITTVSPTYATEILTPERGEALDGFLRWDAGRLVGILNGIDQSAWDPATDTALAAPYSATDHAGKVACRRALLDEARLAPTMADRPVIGVVARMADQKGLDLIADIVPALGTLGARLVVLGAGDANLEARFRYLADVFRDHVSVRIGFDAAYARRIYAGSDLFAMPSRFEPCGLGQLYAMRYGAVPVVSSVGGLRDTVTDVGPAFSIPSGTGIRFDALTPWALLAAIERGTRLVGTPGALAATRTAAMRRDSSWTGPAAEYIAQYRTLVMP